MAKAKRMKTAFPGVVYVESTKKHKGKPNRRFLLRYRWKDENGKPRQFEEACGTTATGMNAEEASLILAELKRNQRSGQGPCTLAERQALGDQQEAEEKAQAEQAKRDAVTFSDYFNGDYLRQAKAEKKPVSWKGEIAHHDLHLAPIVGDIPLKDIKRKDLEAVRDNMQKAGLSPRTQQYVFSTFRVVWNHAVRDGVTTGESPTKHVKLPPIKNQRLRWLTKEEAADLLEEIKPKCLSTWELCLMSLHTGVRFKEAASLKWGHVNFVDGSISILDTKASDRVLFATEAVLDVLKTKKASMEEPPSPDALIWPNNAGNQRHCMGKPFRKAVNDLNLNDGVTDSKMRVCFHSLRHSFASWHVLAGTDIFTLSKLLGHSEIKMTMRYSHLSPNGSRAAVDRFQADL